MLRRKSNNSEIKLLNQLLEIKMNGNKTYVRSDLYLLRISTNIV